MARKNPFASVLDDNDKSVSSSAVHYAARGASRSILNSLDEIAARADKLVEGETIVEIDPDLIDPSFVRDRRGDDEQEFKELFEAIREGGQNSPILVRPHASVSGRYMAVFGHRRLKVAKALGRKVRAIVKVMQDREHILALGHENSARANVPFIERARFAADVARLRYDEDNTTILSALSVDRTTLSKMLSVASLPEAILDAIGEAKLVGRDRWYDLKLLLDNPANIDLALTLVAEDGFTSIASEARFDLLVHRLKLASSRKRVRPKPVTRSWAPRDASMSAEMIGDGKRFTMAMKSKNADAREFGDFLSENLDELYEAFRKRASAATKGI
jgi:ParB family chromosome partitioning protein